MRWLALPLLLTALLTPPAQAAEVNADEDSLVIFLHNAWFEKEKGGAPNPKFGIYAFDDIKTALAKGGELRAPERGPGADPKAEAAALTAKIRAAIDAGWAPEAIKVIGASKGAYIAQLASAELGDPGIEWVLVGGCHNKRMAAGEPPAMTGRVLSIVEETDKVAGACTPYEGLHAGTATFDEIIVTTGLDHGFQFTAEAAWIDPALAW